MEMDQVKPSSKTPFLQPSSFRLRLLALAAEHEELLARTSRVNSASLAASGLSVTGGAFGVEVGLQLSDLPAIPVERTQQELHSHLEDRLNSQHKDVKEQLERVQHTIDLLSTRMPTYRLSRRCTTEAAHLAQKGGLQSCRTIQIGGVSRERSLQRKSLALANSQRPSGEVPVRPSGETTATHDREERVGKTVSFFDPAAAADRDSEAGRNTCSSKASSSNGEDYLRPSGATNTSEMNSSDTLGSATTTAAGNGVRAFMTKRPMRQGAGLVKAKTMDHLVKMFMNKQLTLGTLHHPHNGVEKSRLERLQHWVGMLLKYRFFDAGIGVVILANSVCIGLEITMELEARNQEVILDSSTSAIFTILEGVFLAIYCLELFLRFFVESWRAVLDPWVFFDLVLVALGIGINGILIPISDAISSSSSTNSTSPDDALGSVVERVMVFRIVRLLRLVRALRLMRQFKTLWRLVSGLLGSMDIMLATVALTTLVLYVAACAGVEIITLNDGLKADDHVSDLIDSDFRSIPIIMMTLVQFVTQDSISSIYKPMIVAEPWTSFYFLPIFLVVSIVLLNLVTAVLVEGFFSAATTDKDMRKHHIKQQVKQLVPLVRAFFAELDSDDSGVITLDEVKERLEGDPHGEMPRKLKEMVCLDSVLEFFEAMDQDGDGQIPEEDFINAVLKAAIDEVPIEFSQILLLLRLQRRKLENVERALLPPEEIEAYQSEQTR